ncbi:EAL domain-containing protein [Massilia sp. YIM B02443]|uniref:bifunctional diguanylate cyclase/phosphodiesterase n=1 Tax=Massilia sp. YIM B02443 TaxID=3050127 RepID=UPI0025B7118D|nr:EAL domain-containing protein [Massilia sp. YIM B02443]MDN4039405.1 EAL domain-containing protein [Massilia sp. YIM B02443]
MRHAFASRLLHRSRDLSRAALATCALGLALTALLCGAVRTMEADRTRAEFAQRTAVRVAGVTRAFGEATESLRAVNLFLRASKNVTRAEFDAFAAPLAARHDYLLALAFHRFVSDAERPAFEAERARDWPGFAIRERGPAGPLVRAARRERYLVNDYVAPIEGNEVTYGYDAWSSEQQRAFTRRAIDSGEPAASSIMTLLQGGGRRQGLLIVLPVYRAGALPTTMAERRASVVGDTAVVLDVGLLVGGTLSAVRLLDGNGVAMSLRAPDMHGNIVTAYQHGSLAAPGGRWDALLGGAGLRHVEEFNIAGSPWQLVVQEPPPPLASHTAELTTLALGLVLSFAAAALVQGRVRRTRRIEALVGERTAALERASGALRLYRQAMDAAVNPILLVDARSSGYPIEYVNPACEQVFRIPAPELAGQPLRTVAGLDADLPALGELRQALDEQRAGHALVAQRTRDGAELVSDVYVAPVRDAAGLTTHFVVIVYDVTTARRYEAELERHAHYDTLTGLPNRALLTDRLERAIANAGALPVWTVALDIDHFKLINDTLGRRAGDAALRALAVRIIGALRPSDTAARVGGDDFVLVLAGCADERQAASRVQQVRDAVALPLELEGQSLVLGCSAGVAAWPADGGDADTLVKHAEIAMYRAKTIGRNGVRFYAPDMNAHAFDRLALEGALRHALEAGQFELHFQPQVDLASGTVVGTEALLRWRHPLLGSVRPDRFIALAEETGLIVPIGAWVLRAACQQNRRWQRAGFGPLRVAVNLSARQFAEPDLVATVAQVLDETGLPANSLEIELTESMMVNDVEAAIQTMLCLKRMGVKLSIDDFGTGYSSLSYLKRLPVDVLKIDRSFVQDIAGSADGAALVEAIVSLAHGLRMGVIAEGVETLEQLDCLRGCGCDEVQGHIYGRPQPVEALEPLLRARRVEPAPTA